MNNNERNFVILLVLAFLLPILSWALSALGVPCRSILDDEGLRWLFRHVSDCLHSRLVMFALCCLMMQGVIKESGILPLGRAFRDPKFLRYLAVYAVVFLTILFASIAPDSPLLSVTGGLAGSPLLDGLLFTNNCTESRHHFLEKRLIENQMAAVHHLNDIVSL